VIDARTHDEQKYARPTPAGQSDPLWCVGLGEHLPTPREDTGQLNLFVPSLLGHARRGLDGPSAFLRSLFQLSGVGGWAFEFDVIGCGSPVGVEATRIRLAQLEVINN